MPRSLEAADLNGQIDYSAIAAILVAELSEEAMATRTYRKRSGELMEIPEISEPQAKNAFGEVLERLATVGAIGITRYEKRKAVLLSQKEFGSLRRERSEALDELSARIEGLLAHADAGGKAGDAGRFRRLAGGARPARGRGSSKRRRPRLLLHLRAGRIVAPADLSQTPEWAKQIVGEALQRRQSRS